MSVQKRTDGKGRVRWQVRWREGDRQRSRTFDRKGDAEAFDTERRRRERLGPAAVAQLTDRGATLGGWVEARWRPEHGATLATRTRDRYAESWTAHIAEDLEHLPLTELTVGRLRQWQADRLAAGVSASEIQKARTFLSSVLRHAAESEAIAGNPLALVRAPRAEQKDEVEPLPPTVIEHVRAIVAAPMPVTVAEGKRKAHTRQGARQKTTQRKTYEQPDPRTAQVRARDSALVCLLAYTGMRPSEALALRWGDVRERTILVQRATEADGTIKSTKGRKARSVRLLDPLAEDLAAWKKASEAAAREHLLFPRADGQAWTKDDFGNWRGRAWKTACNRAGLDPAPRPYDLRHSFASLLLAEGRTVHYVAKQLGHSPALTLSTYGHVIDEYEDAPRVDAEAEIQRARLTCCSRDVPEAAASGRREDT